MESIIPSDIPLGKHYVYTLAYPDGKVFYVGKGQGNRIHSHEQEARMNKTHNPYKCNVIRKIWREGGQVVKTIIDYFNTHEEACMLEIALIFFLPDLTNLTRGGDGIVELPRTAEHNRKISKALTGKRLSLEVRRKQSEARKRNPRTIAHLHKLHEARRGKSPWNKGKPGKPISEEERRRRSEVQKGKPTPWLQTPEVRRKQAESLKISPKAIEARRKLNEVQKGRKVSEERRMQMSETWRKDPKNAEHLRRVSEANKGKIRSAETRRKISEIRSGQRMRPRSEEHKRKLSEAGKGRVVSEETRRKIGNANRGRYIGQKVSEETKRKISESQRRRVQSEETRHKLSEARKGKPGRSHTEEAKQKMSKAHKGRPGKSPSEEVRQRISEKLKGRPLSEETRQKMKGRIPANKGVKRATTAHTSIPIIWPLDPQTPLKCEDIDQLSLWSDA